MTNAAFKEIEDKISELLAQLERKAKDIIEEHLLTLSRLKRFKGGISFYSGNGSWYFSPEGSYMTNLQGKDVDDVYIMLSEMVEQYGWNPVPTGCVKAKGGRFSLRWGSL